MKEDFKPGDIVALKSGGWPMTIDRDGHPDPFVDARLFECVWFEPLRSAGSKETVAWQGPYRQTFSEDALVRVDQPKFD